MARALLREPDLLVLDDPTSALDAVTERTFWERLQIELARRGGACIAATHAPAALRRAVEILVLKDGRIEGRGTFERLWTTCGEFRHLLEGVRSKPPPATTGLAP